jgi:hypothetical protein
MKRSAIKRTPFRRPVGTASSLAYDQGDIAELRTAAVPRVQSLRRGVIARIGSEVRAMPKTEPGRNPVLLKMAEGRPCLLTAVERCQGVRGDTTVACHRNEGKGMSLKQSDACTCWGCAPCHEWYDFSGSPRAEKRRAFMAAHLRQLLEWRRIAVDPSEPERFRRAALWALNQLNANVYQPEAAADSAAQP